MSAKENRDRRKSGDTRDNNREEKWFKSNEFKDLLVGLKEDIEKSKTKIEIIDKRQRLL